jgi:predicted alpha/beta-fold hydrolase
MGRKTPDRAAVPRFAARPRLRGGHKMTIYAWACPRRFPRLPPPAVRYFDVAPETRVLAHCHWQARRHEAPTLLALHGLEGSSTAHYIQGLADKAFAAGFNVIRLNQRNCGGTEALTPGLYHSGLTDDPRAVLEELTSVDRLQAIAVVGYSLGGNLALKLAGEYADSPPEWLRAVCAVSPTMDLARCVDALERGANWIYQWNFMRNLRSRMRRKARLFPGRYPVEHLSGVKTIRQFDEAFTAPHHGFAGAADYYHRASAMRVVDRIRVPTLVLTAADDPFVPPDQFDEPAVKANAWITVVVSEHGGHCAFLDAAGPAHDGYWAERAAVEFALGHIPCSPRRPAARAIGDDAAEDSRGHDELERQVPAGDQHCEASGV